MARAAQPAILCKSETSCSGPACAYCGAMMQNRRSPVPSMLPTTTQDASYEGDKSQLSKISAWAASVGGTGATRVLKFAVAGVTALMVLLLVLPSPGAGLALSQLRSVPPSMKLAIIADLDQQSRTAGDKPTWRSIFKEGYLNYNSDNKQYTIDWEEDKWLVTKHAEGVRGMELSELIKFNGRMLTCDDRSGIVFEVMDYDSATPYTVPRHIMMEGDGNTDKGFKCEWMAVKDEHLYVGSFGKEYTNPDGSLKNKNNNWVMVFDANLMLVHVDWSSKYEAMREHFGYGYPAYLLHETVLWSQTRGQWVFLPRRMSKTAYNEDEDEKRGANTVMLANDAFTSFQSFNVGKLTPTRGFSTAKFVPGSQEQVLVAIKSEEVAATMEQHSYITVFNMDGEVLLPETAIPGNHKYEGLEFIHL